MGGESEAAGVDFDDVDDAAFMLSSFLATEVDGKVNCRPKRKLNASRTNADNRAKLVDELSNYVHVAPCQRLFSLAWCDDRTHAPASYSGPLPLKFSILLLPLDYSSPPPLEFSRHFGSVPRIGFRQIPPFGLWFVTPNFAGHLN